MRQVATSGPETGREKIFFYVLLAFGSVLLFSFAFMPYGIATRFMEDDAYYNMTIARNIALGNGPTFDGTVETNGFHPIPTLIMIPIYRLTGGDLFLSARVILFVYAIIGVLVGILLYKTVAYLTNREAALICLLLWFSTSYVLKMAVSGMDTILAIFLLVSTLYYYLIRVRDAEDPPPSRFVLLGILAGGCILCRLDQGFLAVALALDILYTRRKSLSGKGLRNTVVRLAAFGLVATVVVSPWFLYNKIEFGSFMPLNGVAVRQISWYASNFFINLFDHVLAAFAAGDLKSLADYREAFLNAKPVLQTCLPAKLYLVNIIWALALILGAYPLTAVPFFFVLLLPGVTAKIVCLGVVLAIPVVVIAGNRRMLREYIREQRVGRMAFTWVFAALLFLSYTFYIFGQWAYPRYLFPIVFLLFLSTGWIYDIVFRVVWTGKLGFRGTIPKILMVLILVFSFAAQYKVNVLDQPEGTPYYKVAQWVSANLPEDALLGALQAGTIQYYCPQTVINLDGKVNETALKAMKEGKLFAFAESLGVDYILDMDFYLHHALVHRSSAPVYEKLELVHEPEFFLDYLVYRVRKEPSP